MELIRLKIEGFKKIKSIDLELATVNILVGANGSGKSSVLQSTHLGCCMIRQAERVDTTTSTIGVEELDYLPTNDYKTLGHETTWGNNKHTPSSKLTLTFKKDDNTEVLGFCELRSARNAGISISGTLATELSPLLRQKKKFFSAYIPGISGITNKEERRSRKVILKSCSFGDSNVILRNALLLLKEENQENIQKIEEWLSRIIGEVQIKVDHDNDKDLHIRCSIIYQNNLERPIELAGTGFIQLIQIFCYVLLFNPGILLIDEPDIHLHPNVQEKLASVLADIAKERKMKVLMTTHSPFIVRGAPVDAKVYWLQEGIKNSENRAAVELAIGWGAFGKKIIIFSEDGNLVYLRKIVAQWPEIDRNVAFYPGSGFKSLPTPKQAKEIHDALGEKFKIIVHRDRDALTDIEVAKLVAEYQAEGIHLWLPLESDIESYFCQPNFIESFIGCTLADAEGYLTGVLNTHSVPIRDQFNSQRTTINQELYKQGGSPTNDDVWNQFAARPLKGAKGKFVLGNLQDSIGQHKFSKNLIFGAKLNGQVAPDLKHKIKQVLVA